MIIRSLSLLALCAILCACGTAPKPILPDGSRRIPVNSQGAIDNYQAQNTHLDDSMRAQTTLASQIEALKREIADLKRMLGKSATQAPVRHQQEKTSTAPPMVRAALRTKTKRIRPPRFTVPALVVASNRSAL